jgi:hypothetical protein
MKQKYLVLLMLSILFSNLSFGHGDEHKENSHSHYTSHGSIEGKTEIIKGQLIGLTCFIKHSSKGSSHKDCFKDCAAKGLPIGVLTDDNKIYQISGEGHGDLKSTNKKFLRYAEESVIIKGQIFKKNGFNMIVVNGIKKAN